MSEYQKEINGNISRRQFLRDAGFVIGGATIGSMTILNACKDNVTETKSSTVVVSTTSSKPVNETGSQPISGSIPVVNLTVNGGKYALPVLQANETLHELLREELGLTSLKEMCSGEGACGSCSAIVDGRPVLTCMILAMGCNNKVIQTAEGVAKANTKLLDAYVYNHCMQCGYCTPGFIVTAQALLNKNPKPTEDDIREALGGNICRCATYPFHALAIQEATGQRTPGNGKP
jgi:aerobic-type carbon monoxide dehydrogenase small subunit (CoxS/CutS family)